MEERGRLLCGVVSETLDSSSPFATRHAALLRRVVNDRGQLRHLDYLLARLVLRALTGEADVKAFRVVPYRRLRQEWHLVSLVAARNG